MPLIKTAILLLSVVLFTACSTALKEFETLYGPSEPRDRKTPQHLKNSPEYVSFSTQIQPILNNRCVVCHACNDAPCQLNLTSIEGIDRGANTKPVYNGGKFLVQRPTRLDVDALNTPDWRKKASLKAS